MDNQRELLPYEIKSSLSLLSDIVPVLPELCRGPLTQSELKLYRGFLDERGVLIDRSDELTRIVNHIQARMLDLWGSEIGSQNIAAFFQKFDQERIIVVEDNSYANIRNSWFDYRGKYSFEQKSEAQDLALTDPLSSIIFVGNEEFNPVVVTEELMHLFLIESSKKKIPTLHVVNTISSALSTRISKNKQDDKFNKNPEIARLEKYCSRPDEQLAKAMTLSIHPGSLPSNIHPLYRESAEMGNKRIKELGWNAILKGRWKTSHEDDFIVRFSEVIRPRIDFSKLKQAFLQRRINTHFEE